MSFDYREKIFSELPLKKSLDLKRKLVSRIQMAIKRGLERESVIKR